MAVSASPQFPRLVINGYPLSLTGQGIGIHTKRLIAGLLRRGLGENLRVVVPAEIEQTVQWIPRSSLDVVEVSLPLPQRQFVRDMFWTGKIAAYSKRRYGDSIFHCPREHFGWSNPRRTVTTIHDANHWRFPASKGGLARSWWRRATEKFAANQSPLTLTVSQWAKRDLVELAFIPEKKIQVIYNWVDPESNRAEALTRFPGVRARLNLPSRYFLYVGGFSANKNIDFLLRAYARANAKENLPILVIAGDLEQYRRAFGRDFLETLQGLNVPREKILTTGFIPAEELSPLMAGADVLIYPSVSEGFGYPPVEAQALGTPVIVANATSLIEVVSKDECRFDPADENDLGIKLQLAAHQPSIFNCPLSEMFTERFGIQHYLDTLQTLESPLDRMARGMNASLAL